ncbi:hypothetical protein [Mameliella alba]|nr:hypothetical protein [Mameliella alba]
MSAIERMPLQSTKEMKELSERLFDGWTDEERRRFCAERFREIDEFATANCLSVLCAAYAIVEHTLHKVAEAALHLEDPKKSPQEFRDLGIKQSKNALTKGVGISWATVNEPWQKMLEYGVLRNLFMHKAGLVEPSHKDIGKLRSYPDVGLKKFGDFDDLKQIVIKDHYVRTAIETMQDFLEQIHREIEGAAAC